MFEPPLLRERTADARLSRGANNIMWIVGTERVERWTRKNGADFQRDGTWPLPAEFTPKHSLHVAPIDDKETWLLDTTERRAWRLQGSAWSKVSLLGDDVASAAALPSGEVVVNTPFHSSHAFAIVDVAGQVRSRFGSRIAPKVSQQVSMYNTWRLATLREGKIAAAHAYLPLLRIYKSSGELIREIAITIPSVAVIEERRRALDAVVEVDVKECCISSKVVHFATAISAQDAEIAIRYGLDPKLEIFAANDGSWKETIRIEVPESQRTWLTAGIAYFGDRVAAAELDRVALYRRLPSPTIRGTVLEESGAPLAGARVIVSGTAGMRAQIVTTPSGIFELRGPQPADAGKVMVTADGYLPLQRAGLLGEITKSPFTLRRVPEQCVVVRSGVTGNVIQKYRLQVGQSSANQDQLYRNEGKSVEVNDEHGRGCIPAPFDPPLLVRVSATGHASKEIELADTADVEIELRAEVPIRVATRTGGGSPIAKAKVYLLPAKELRGSSFAISDDSVAVTDEEGRATLSGFEAGDYLVIAEHPDYLRREMTAKLDDGASEITLVMERGGQMTVQVLDAATRQPLADSQVHGDPKGAAITRALHCTTNANGTCVLTGLPLGRYTIHVEHSGYARAHETVVVGPAEGDPRVVVRLAGATAISGRIGGTENYPGVALEVAVSKPGVPAVSAPIGSGGEFRISEAPTGNIDLWVMEKEVDSALLHRKVAIPEGMPTFRIDLDLPRPVRLSGRIIDAADVSCGACTIVLDRISGDYAPTSRRGTTTADGRYEVRLPAVGPYMARIRDSSTGTTMSEPIDVAADGHHDFRLGGRSLEVRVKLQGGTAATTALVSLQSAGLVLEEANVDSYGVARFRSIAPRQVRVTATTGSRTATREITLEREATTVELTLGDTAALRLRVVDAVSQLPLYRIEARVTGARGESILLKDLVRDDEGVFVLPFIGGGPMTVVIESVGYAVRTMHDVVSGETTQTVSLVPRWRAFTVDTDLATLRPCSIEVRDNTDRPVALSARAGAGPFPFTLGSAVFSGLDWGVYRVLLHTCDGRTIEKTLRLVEGGEWNVRFP